MEKELALVAQEYVYGVCVPLAFPVSVTDAPLQIIPSLLVVPEVSAFPMVTVGRAFTVQETVLVADCVQPLPLAVRKV